MIKIKSVASKEKRDISLWKVEGHPVEAKNVLIIGGFHGDEVDGVKILESFLLSECASSCKNNLYIVPCLNPDGYAKCERVNSNGVDLNRNFPTKNWVLGEKNEFFGGEAPASELETKFMVEVIEELRPDIILTIHAPFKIVNYDGHAEIISNNIAKIMGYPVQSDIGYPTPGSFGTYCGIERGIPTVTLELGDDEDFTSLETRCLKALGLLAFC